MIKILKHLPGQHNQKLHGTKQPYDNLYNLLSEMSGQPRSEIRTSLGAGVESSGYNADGFRAEVEVKWDNQPTILGLTVRKVTDPAKAEAFVNKILVSAKKHEFTHIALKLAPPNLLEKLNAYYVWTAGDLMGITRGAFKFMEKKYDLKTPKEFVLSDKTTPVDDNQLLDWTLKNLGVVLEGEIKMGPYRHGHVRLPVVNLNAVKHPKGDVPLYTEYLTTLAKNGGLEAFIKL